MCPAAIRSAGRFRRRRCTHWPSRSSGGACASAPQRLAPDDAADAARPAAAARPSCRPGTPGPNCLQRCRRPTRRPSRATAARQSPAATRRRPRCARQNATRIVPPARSASGSARRFQRAETCARHWAWHRTHAPHGRRHSTARPPSVRPARRRPRWRWSLLVHSFFMGLSRSNSIRSPCGFKKAARTHCPGYSDCTALR